MSQPPIIFDGSNGMNSDTLVRLIRTHSLEVGKEKDDRWIAITASACFEGSALEWYDEQAEEVQESWKLLRRALLQRWPPENTSSGTLPQRYSEELTSNLGEASSSGATSTPETIPTPAAAPPVAAPQFGGELQAPQSTLTRTSQTGRIRVDYRAGGTLGYVSSVTQRAGEYVTTPDKTNALVVTFVQSRDPHEMVVANTSGRQGIGIACISSTLPKVDDWMINGILTRFHLHSLSRANPSSAWVSQSSQMKGGVNAYIWTVLLDGSITVLWGISNNRGRYPLDAAVVIKGSAASDKGKIFLLSSFPGMVAKEPKWHLVQVDFHFEPI